MINTRPRNESFGGSVSRPVWLSRQLRRIALSVAVAGLLSATAGCGVLSGLAWNLVENGLDRMSTPPDGRDQDADGLTDADRQARFEEARIRQLQRDGLIH